MLIRHLDADSSPSGNGGDNTNPQSRQTKRYIIFQVPDSGNAYSGRWYNLVQGNCGYAGGLELFDINAIIAKGTHDLILVGLQFLQIGRASCREAECQYV